MSTKTSRGLKNLNPGNIRKSAVKYTGEKSHSTDPSFKQFESLEAGYRAIFVLLHTYRVRGYADTIESLISRYAPPSENNTEMYIRRVERQSATLRDKKLNTLSAEQMIPIVAAISEVENGTTADLTAIQAGWQWFERDYK